MKCPKAAFSQSILERLPRTSLSVLKFSFWERTSRYFRRNLEINIFLHWLQCDERQVQRLVAVSAALASWTPRATSLDGTAAAGLGQRDGLEMCPG